MPAGCALPSGLEAWARTLVRQAMRMRAARFGPPPVEWTSTTSLRISRRSSTATTTVDTTHRLTDRMGHRRFARTCRMAPLSHTRPGGSRRRKQLRRLLPSLLPRRALPRPLPARWLYVAHLRPPCRSPCKSTPPASAGGLARLLWTFPRTAATAAAARLQRMCRVRSQQFPGPPSAPRRPPPACHPHCRLKESHTTRRR